MADIHQILAAARGLHLGYVLLYCLTRPIVWYAELRSQGAALGPFNDTAATLPAVSLAETPPVCVSNASHYLERCQPQVLDGDSFQSRNETAGSQEVHTLSLGLPQSSTMGPSSSAMLHIQLPVEASEQVHVNVLPTSATEGSSTALIHGSNESLPTPAASTCALSEDAYMALDSTRGIDESRLQPIPRTCGLPDCPLYSATSTCGLNEQSSSVLTSTFSLEPRLQISAVPTYARNIRPHTL